MRRLWAALPGPVPAKVLQSALLVVLVLLALFFLFEWAGTFLDSGGTIGT